VRSLLVFGFDPVLALLELLISSSVLGLGLVSVSQLDIAAA